MTQMKRKYTEKSDRVMKSKLKTWNEAVRMSAESVENVKKMIIHENHIGPSCVPITRICSFSFRSFSVASWFIWMKSLKETAMKMKLAAYSLEMSRCVGQEKSESRGGR